MAGPLVSAVIPTYNYGRFVTEAVESVLAQRYPDLEVIVVDDGSKDDTRQRLAPYLDRIRYLYQDNKGLSAARNTGSRAARGEWIALLDSDDVWHPRKLEFQMEYLARRPFTGLLAARHVTDRSGGWPEVSRLPEGPATPVTMKDLVMYTRFAPSSVLIHKDCFPRVGLFDTELRSAEDRDMWIRIACHFPVVKIELPLLFYRVHGSSMSTVAARMEANELKVLHKAFAGVPALRQRPLFRRKTFSFAAYQAAYMYGAAKSWLPALGRLVRSFLLWPFPYRRAEVDRYLARPRMLAVLLMRMLGIRRAL
jgi:glycosyltransferase involved in cell wall biosynthesis